MSSVNVSQLIDAQLNAFGGAYAWLINGMQHDLAVRQVRNKVNEYNALVGKYNQLHAQATNAFNILRHENMLLEIENAQLKKKLGMLR